MEHKNWNGFNGQTWKNEINVRDFIQQNYTEYKGDSSFLKGATPRTEALMKKLQALSNIHFRSVILQQKRPNALVLRCCSFARVRCTTI